jgi:hypothetical protein
MVKRIDIDPANPLSFRKLIVFVDDNPALFKFYTLTDYQCYWFCWIIVSFVEEDRAGSYRVVEGPAMGRGGTAWKLTWDQKMDSYEKIKTEYLKNIPSQALAGRVRDNADEIVLEDVRRMREELAAAKRNEELLKQKLEEQSRLVQSVIRG